MAGLYQGSLKLDRVTGIRHDKGQRMTYVPVKKDEKLVEVKKSTKNIPNVTSDGLKKS